MQRLGRTGLAGVLALALLLAACTTDGSSAPPVAGPDGRGGPTTTAALRPDGLTAVSLPDGLELAGALTSFDACEDLLAYTKERALEIVTPYGLGGGHAGPWFGEDTATADGAEESDDAGAASDLTAGGAGEDFSGTNVQEAGVDEPDVLKTDGSTLYLVSQGAIEVVDVTSDSPRSLARLPIDDWGAQLMLHDDKLLVTTSGGLVLPFAGDEDIAADADIAAEDSIAPGPWYGSGTTLTAIDVSDPSAPEVQERLNLDGHVVSSRMVDGVVRAVIRTEAGINLPWEYPQGGGLRAEQLALEANREIIRASAAEDWLPYAIHERADGTRDEDILVACNRVARPDPFAGLGVLSVLTIDLATGTLVPDTNSATAILAPGDTVYASPATLVVATTRWIDDAIGDPQRDRRQQDLTTELHAFDLTDPRTATYLGSGEVPGTLLSQWAMSEHDGHLRVASTVGDPWGNDRRPSESVVSVLEVTDGGILPRVGQVTGLGLTERIYAVRFMGDLGYVVTFRETDPLYTLDLRDPTDPRVTGELKIMGYSAYLHPVEDDLLLGVGQDADARGMTQGLQVSLFDVADPTDPTLLDQLTLEDATSDVEYDHRAFLHWPSTATSVVPFQRWFDWSTIERRGGTGQTSGALVFTADRRTGLTPEATVSHLDPYLRDLGIEDPFAPQEGEDPYVQEERIWEHTHRTRILRSAVIGDRLLTVSEAGIAVHDLHTLIERGWLTFD